MLINIQRDCKICRYDKNKTYHAILNGNDIFAQ